MRPFHTRSQSSLAGVEGRGKAFWQANEEFIWNVLWCWRRFACSYKAMGETIGGHTDRSLYNRSSSMVWVFYQHLHQLESNMISPLSIKSFFCRSELSLWFNTLLLTACLHGLSKPDPMVSSCAQQFVGKHSTKIETLNMREHQRKWFRLTKRVPCLNFVVTGSDRSLCIGRNNSGGICFLQSTQPHKRREKAGCSAVKG